MSLNNPLNKIDPKDPNYHHKVEQNFKIQQNIQVLEQYTLQKSIILNKVKTTYILPYLLNMNYMVGELNNVKITENPIDELSPYLNGQDGINKTLNVNFTREELKDWEIFKYTIYLFENEQYTNTDELNIYLLLKIVGNQLNLVIFGLYGMFDSRVIGTDKCLQFLDNDIKIKDTKIDLGLIQ